jgi:RNA polymerase sigma factor (sigma-70 family)
MTPFHGPDEGGRAAEPGLFSCVESTAFTRVERVLSRLPAGLTRLKAVLRTATADDPVTSRQKSGQPVDPEGVLGCYIVERTFTGYPMGRPMEDKLLVLRCQRGSREALTRIYEKYKTDLLLLALSLLNDKTAAEDVVHDVFLSFVRHLDDFRLTGSLKGYLLTCAANQARNWNKAERVRGRVQESVAPNALTIPKPSGLEAASQGADAPLETLVCNEQLETLSGALAQLPLEQREIVMLHLHGQMTFRAIAKARQISTNTAKSRYRYGIDKLRSILNGEVGPCDRQTT